jgi:hypothetical protein
LRILLNAGFGTSIGAGDLTLIRGLGFLGVRQDVPSVVSVVPISAELMDAAMSAILVLGPAVWHSPAACRWVAQACSSLGLDYYLEIGNELDATEDPRAYALAFQAVEKAIREADPAAGVITAGITSTHAAGLLWLRQVVGTGLISEQAILGYHTYRSGDPEQAHSGFASRAEEFTALREIARGRRIACTEMGWSDGPPKRTGWPCSWFARGPSEGQVAQYLRTELEINRQFEAECCVVYQLNDGSARDEHFGIRRRDGTLKSSAHVLEAA